MKEYNFSLNQIDTLFLFIISWFLSIGYFLWFLRNIIRVQHPLILICTVIVSILVSWIGVRYIRYSRIKLTRNDVFPYLLFVTCLTFSFVFLLEPIFSRPYSAIGIMNKDAHDGITSFISLYGYPPEEYKTYQNVFIPRSVSDKFLGYANSLHSTASVLNILGVSPFHSTWVIVVLGLLISSLSIFLFAKSMTGNTFYAAIIGGLFSISSFRLSFGAITSIVMMYSFTLLLPVLLIWFVVLDNKLSKHMAIIPSIGLGLLVASYQGIVFIFITLMCVYGFFVRQKGIGKLFLYSIPIVVVTFLFQREFYWLSTVASLSLNDPYETSQFLFPADKPLYMIFWVVSIIITSFSWAKANNIKRFFFCINLCFFILMSHRLFLYLMPSILQSVAGYGTMTYILFARLALLQPFFYIFFLTGFSLLIRNNYLKIFIAGLAIFSCFIIRIDLPLYQTMEPYIERTYYNISAKNYPFTLLSHIRFFVDDRKWTVDYLDALDYLKSQSVSDINVLVWHDIDPFITEEAISRWGSVYVTHKLLRRTDVGTLTEQIDQELIDHYREKQIEYLIVLYPSDNTLDALRKSSHVNPVWYQKGIFIYHLILT